MFALQGLKVLDLSRLGPGPYCTMVLADLGADVLKIEEPVAAETYEAERKKGPESRKALDFVPAASPHNALNRGKRSMTLNLKMKPAQEVFYRLVAGADVVVEEFRPGVTKRLGVDYDTLSRINSRVVYCAVTGYGQRGPYKDMVGHDVNCISMAGVLGAIGLRDGPPVIPGNLLADFAGGGANGVVGILAALLARDKTGRGQFVDISMMDSVMSLLAWDVSNYSWTGHVPRRGETAATGATACYNVYQARDGRYLSIGCLEPRFWTNLCRALGREDLIPLQYSGPEQQEELKRDLAKTFRGRTRDEWFELLKDKDICVGKVYDLKEALNDPHVRQREMVLELEHPDEGHIRQVGIAVKLSETPGRVRSLTPAPGQHTREVLGELGYTEPEIGRLKEIGAI